MVWLGVFLGLNVPTVEVGQQVIVHRAVPDHVHLERHSCRLATLPTFLQPIAEWNPISTLTNSLRELWGNPNPSGETSLATYGADPDVDHLAGDLRRGVRAARRATLPVDGPLSRGALARPPAYHQRVLPAPALLAVGLLLGLVVLLPARRLQLGGVSGRLIGVYAFFVWALAFLLVFRPFAARFLVPILVVAYIAPFVVGPERISGIVRRGTGGRGPGGTGGSGTVRRGDPSRPPMKNVTPPDDPTRPG